MDVAKKAVKKAAKPSAAEAPQAPTQDTAPATEPDASLSAIAEDPAPADASDGIGDDSPLIEGGELDPERAALRRETDELRAEIKRLELKLSKVDELDMAIIDAGIEVDELEAHISDLDKERKDLKEDLKKAVATLRACVIRRKTGQKELFTEPQKAGAPIVPPAPVDVGGEAAISVLLSNSMKSIVGKEEFAASKDRGQPIGMTEKQIEVLEGEGFSTVGKLEAEMRKNPYWNRDIKGFGPDTIDRLTITLAAYRINHPMPNEPAKGGESAAGLIPQPAAEAPAAEPVGEVIDAEFTVDKSPEQIGELIERAADSVVAPAWQAAVDRIRNMLGTANELMNNGPGDCIEFMESVTTSATEMLGWISEREHVTADQETAINNWAEGIAKWQPAS